MVPCACGCDHPRKRIVLTGGPGAGKTAVLELVRQFFCRHVQVIPESASMLFGGGFPRKEGDAFKRAAQRAIYFVQRELERCQEAEPEPAITLCDRGTLDGLAYWPGPPEEFWRDVGSTREEQLSRYHAVVHMRTPSPASYDRSNSLRLETPEMAMEVDRRIVQAWDGHPRRYFVESTDGFLDKALRTLETLSGELPECCRHHTVSAREDISRAVSG